MVGLQIGIIILIILGLCVMFYVNEVIQDKLEKIHNFLHDIYKHYTSPTEGVKEVDENEKESEEEDEKGLENLASSVFNLVDEILDGKKELEDIDNEE